MLCCRLLGENGAVLAQTTLEAPDLVCVVLDPTTPDATGAPRPVQLTPTGPAVFQARLPQVEGAATLEVIRLAGEREPRSEERPLGQLLAAISLSP